MTVKITTANGGSDSLDFGCAQTAIVATVTGTEVSSGEGKLELKTTTGGTSATKVTVLADGNVGIGTGSPTAFGGTNLHIQSSGAAAYGSMLVGSGTYLFEILANQNSGVMSVGARSNHSLDFVTNDTAQMTIDSAGLLKFNSGYGSVATAYGCRAWVNFNGTGTVAIRESGNVSSITDNATGDYTVNFATALVDANYAAGFMVSGVDGNNDTITACIKYGVAPATSSVRIIVDMRTTGERDVAYVTVSIFR